MERFPVKVLVPMVLSVILVLAFLSMLLTVLVDTARGTSVDSTVILGMGGLCGTLITTLGGFWLASSDQRPEPPDVPPGTSHAKIEQTGDEESDDWNRRHGYLEFRRMARWKPCSPHS